MLNISMRDKCTPNQEIVNLFSYQSRGKKELFSPFPQIFLKDQIVNVLVCGSHGICHNCTTRPLCKGSHRRYGNDVYGRGPAKLQKSRRLAGRSRLPGPLRPGLPWPAPPARLPSHKAALCHPLVCVPRCPWWLSSVWLAWKYVLLVSFRRDEGYFQWISLLVYLFLFHFRSLKMPVFFWLQSFWFKTDPSVLLLWR